jgi:hypothetical protein
MLYITPERYIYIYIGLKHTIVCIYIYIYNRKGSRCFISLLIGIYILKYTIVCVCIYIHIYYIDVFYYIYSYI